MQVIPLNWDDTQVQIDTLGSLVSTTATNLSFGIASFPAGTRHPAEGFSRHEGTEISFILDGSFAVETPTGVSTVARHNLVIIPAGEPHATLASEPGRVAHFLVSEIQE